GRQRARSDQLLARLERNISHLSRCRINLIERAKTIRKDLHRVEVPSPPGFNPRSRVGALDTFNRFLRLFLLAAARRSPSGRDVKGRTLIGKGRRFWQWRWQFVIVADLRRFERGTGTESAQAENERRTQTFPSLRKNGRKD